MKRLISAMVVLTLVASIAWAAPKLLGTRQMPGDEARVRQTIWAHPKASPSTGIINATGTTTAYPTGIVCDEGSMVFDTVAGSDIKNVALQVAYTDILNPQNFSGITFTNAVGTTSAPYHQVDTNDTDTHKYDFNSRAFNVWRLNCLAGCDLTNTITSVYGMCWREGK
jgi:hypothetical protein